MSRRAARLVGATLFVSASGIGACSSFSAATTPDAGADASVDFDSAAPDTSTIATPRDASSIDDAARDSATCGTANLATDSLNCGTCGRHCVGVGADCKDSECVHHIFVLNQPQSGNLGGLAGADALCTAAAATGILKSNAPFKAWLSSSKVDAVTRLQHGTRPYVTVKNVPVAASFLGLLSGTLMNPIDHSEDGAQVTATTLTATAADGTYLGPSDCGEWSSTAVMNATTVGKSDNIDSNWTTSFQQTCEEVAHLYCVEQ